MVSGAQKYLEKGWNRVWGIETGQYDHYNNPYKKQILTQGCPQNANMGSKRSLVTILRPLGVQIGLFMYIYNGQSGQSQ